MNRYVVTPCVALCLATGMAAFGQASASVSGTLTNPDNAAVGNAPVEFKNIASGAVFKATSQTSGAYAIVSLPAGTYAVNVTLPCCNYTSFQKEGVVLKAGEPLKMDIRIEWGENLGTVADDPLERLNDIRGGAPVPTGPAPKALDAHPDLSGVWLPAPRPNQPPPPLQPWAAALYKKRSDDKNKDYPANYCLPGNPMSFSLNFPFQLVQSPTMMVILQEFTTPGFRQIFLDGRKHPEDPNPSWMGHSVGKWDGDTLVIDSVGFNDKTWLNFYGIPHTEQLHTIERVRRVDQGHLEVEIIIEDPGAFTSNWKRVTGATLAPKADEEILEYICNENNKDALHFVGK